MSRRTVPISSPDIGAEEMAAVQEVLESGLLAQGPRVAGFEEAFARFCGTGHAVAVGNGTQALTLALMALDPPLGSVHRGHRRREVITTPFTFIATANAILAAGGVPVLVDIDPETFNIDPGLVGEAVTPNTRAVLPVHLYGQPADMAPLVELARQRDLAIVEDACQAHGAEYDGRRAGALHGDLPSSCGTFSFYPTKNMTTGEGGMITTDDGALADRLRHLRNHGMPPDDERRYRYLAPGHNFRMTEMAAAMGQVQLERLPGANRARIRNAGLYDRGLGDVGAAVTPTVRSSPPTTHVFHQYTIRVRPVDRRIPSIEARRGLMEALEAEGIHARIYYPSSLADVRHLGPSSRVPGSLERTEEAVREVLSLPVGPHVEEEDVERVTSVVRRELEG